MAMQLPSLSFMNLSTVLVVGGDPAVILWCPTQASTPSEPPRSADMDAGACKASPPS
jgi:hypothetical protein